MVRIFVSFVRNCNLCDDNDNDGNYIQPIRRATNGSWHASRIYSRKDYGKSIQHIRQASLNNFVCMRQTIPKLCGFTYVTCTGTRAYSRKVIQMHLNAFRARHTAHTIHAHTPTPTHAKRYACALRSNGANESAMVMVYRKLITNIVFFSVFFKFVKSAYNLHQYFAVKVRP